jgi:aspartate beta-hydroxylase
MNTPAIKAISAKTHIKPHHGPTNKKLRIQLPLRVPKPASPSIAVRSDAAAVPLPSCCWLRAADQKVYLTEGKAIVFDDSFEHEAANEHPSEPRVVLVIDFWHPDLNNEEVKYVLMHCGVWLAGRPVHRRLIHLLH